MTDRSTEHWSGRHYDADHVAGPLSFLNPTTRLLAVKRPKGGAPGAAAATAGAAAAADRSDSDGDGVAQGAGEGRGREEGDAPELDARKQAHAGPRAEGIYNVWRSRDNRKGRHALALTPSAAGASGAVQSTTRFTDTWSATLAGIGRMALRYPVWDVSYDVATIFTLGSVVWVINGFFVLLPITNPTATFPGESAWGGGVSAVVGATIFEVGSVLLMLEAVNENRSECFGWALEHSAEDLRLTLTRDRGGCRHHHAQRSRWLGPGAAAAATAAPDLGTRAWTWWPSWYELRTHYLRDIGFLACLSQMVGATVFWISGFTGLPQILGVLSLPATNGVYWLPQVIGGTGFIVSSWLFMLETQKRWYIPAPRVLGWHVGFWNLVGAVGFTLCGAFGFAPGSEACVLAGIWSTFVGSWAFLIGSVIQWYESLDKYPIIVDKNIPSTTTTTTTTTTTSSSEQLAEKAEAPAA